MSIIRLIYSCFLFFLTYFDIFYLSLHSLKLNKLHDKSHKIYCPLLVCGIGNDHAPIKCVAEPARAFFVIMETYETAFEKVSTQSITISNTHFAGELIDLNTIRTFADIEDAPTAYIIANLAIYHFLRNNLSTPPLLP